MATGTHEATQETAVRTNVLVRALIYSILILFAVYYLLPLYVMLVNSVKPLDEIRQGNMMSLPQLFTIEPWLSAWSTAQIGVQPTGLKPYFINSVLMVIPAVAISAAGVPPVSSRINSVARWDAGKIMAGSTRRSKR